MVKNDQPFLCITSGRQDLALIRRIVEDFGRTLVEQLDVDFVQPCDLSYYAVVFVTFDVAISLLERLFSDRKHPSSPIFALLAGGFSSIDHCLNLKRDFGFDLVVERPIKKSLFVAQLSSLLNDESRAFSEIERREIDFSERLVSDYIGVLDNRHKALEKVIEELFGAQFSDSTLSEAKRLAHNMRGTSGSLGLMSLADRAKTIEENLWAKDFRHETLQLLLKELKEEIVRLQKSHRFTLQNNNQDFSKANVLALLREPLDDAELDSLTKASINVSTVYAEELFFAKLGEPRLDAVLIDINTPSVDGAGLVQNLRERCGRSDLPIGIIQNARSNAQNESSYAHAGISFVLRKPINAANLVEASSYLVQSNLSGRSRILIVDDDEDFTSIVASVLSAEGILVKTSNNPFSAEAMLQDFNADLLIVDVNMPGQSGVELCRRLRSQKRWSDFPILFLTAEHNIDTRIKAYEAGADDYLSKPLIVPELLARVKGRLERVKLLNERLEKDVLTGLLLRRSFLERIEELLHQANRLESECSIAIIDVDRFKAINDTYGHVVGDEILSSLGQHLAQRFRVGDLRGRWGGEEFVLALPHTSASTAKGALERLLDEIKSIEYKSSEGVPFKVSFSGGVAAFPRDGANFKELLLKADGRLYLAKESGRSNICATDKR
jgi:diguanylate cyclase (GGDEF)-like protein